MKSGKQTALPTFQQPLLLECYQSSNQFLLHLEFVPAVPKNLWDAHTECMGNLVTIKIAGAISTGAQDMLCILKRSRHRGPKLDSLRSLNRPRLKIGACMDEATRGISPEGPEVSDHVHLVKISEVVTNV